jgi:hypothetical protein
MTEPINILVKLVIDSANDVLAGLQTYDEHEEYLKELAVEYQKNGIKLPLELDERTEHDEKDNRPQTHLTEKRHEPQAAEKLHDNLQGDSSRTLFD